ncbi:hypothetical protein MASR2M117_03730 [Paludibacter sp.]
MKKFVLIKDEKSRVYAIEGELELLDFYELAVSEKMEEDLGLSNFLPQIIHSTDYLSNNALLKQIEYQIPPKLSEYKDFYRIGTYKLFIKGKILENNSHRKKLTKREFEILQFLFENKNTTVTRKEILEKFWKCTDFYSSRCLDVFISKLRKYLIHDSNIYLITIRREGVVLKC